jgi:hypothetical protein
MAKSAGGQIINKCANVIMQLIFCNGLVDDGLEVGRAITRAKR